MQIKILRFLLSFYHDRFSQADEFEPLPELPNRELHPSHVEWQGVPPKSSAKVRQVLESVHRSVVVQSIRSPRDLNQVKIPLEEYRLRDAAKHCVFYLHHRNIEASVAKRGKTWSVYVPRREYEKAKEIHARFVPASPRVYAASRRTAWSILILGWTWIPLFLFNFVLFTREWDPALLAFTAAIGLSFGAVVAIAAWNLARITFNLIRK